MSALAWYRMTCVPLTVKCHEQKKNSLSFYSELFKEFVLRLRGASVPPPS
jgi:hypothetical protein